MNGLSSMILFGCFLIAFYPAKAQEQPKKSIYNDSARTFTCFYPEVHAEFPGSYEALFQYLADKTENVDLRDKPAGLVILRFTISKTGEIQNITVLKGLHTELDQIALNAVKKMPAWAPASNNNEIVEEVFTLPIRFGENTSKTKQKRKSKN